ncbi:serine/threonine-protein kinase EDR1 [Ananas comosus]|uniref:non-specific serine/threonine protein kinase n=1 Tax=Ananas comosus TaxID=4615 RepID=A0A6P5G6Z8_ANACO|nr:serine/threonine-protein kinase EDR1 [Ananas comosus]
MKNLFKIKRPHRSNEIPSSSSPSPSPLPSPSPSPSPSSLAPSCGSDHRAAAPSSSAAMVSPTSKPPAEEAAGNRQDYFSSEEEFQMQLALAISASNSDYRGDPDGDQIRAAQLLSLGSHRIDQDREVGTAESLSRRYWDYNVLDYHERIIDGFYDIFGFSPESSRQGKMPSLVDLQTSIGDLGFEVIIVNRSIDTALVELEQIAQCISLDCPVAETALLVQRISELVTDNLGGPVKDANDMLARWMEKSTELRTSLQTSLLPIGCIKIGLSRHRALLFKVLADNVGIPCKLVKGSHYTGVDDDAVNIIKLDNEREFLVDLMAAAGTLIPADVLSAKGTSLNSNPRFSKNQTTWSTNSSGFDLSGEASSNENKGENSSSENDSHILDKRSEYDKEIVTPYSQNPQSGSSSITTVRFSTEATRLLPRQQPNQLSTSNIETSSKQKDVVSEDPMWNGNFNASADSQETVDPKNLFAELNPFKVVGAGKTSAQFRGWDNRDSGNRGHRENIISGPGRPPQPLAWKNWSACNEVANSKQYNFVEELFPRKNVGDNGATSSQISSDGKSTVVNISGDSDMSSWVVVDSSEKTISDTYLNTTYVSSGVNKDSEKDRHGDLYSSHMNAKGGGPLTSVQSSGDKYMRTKQTQGLVSQSSVEREAKNHGLNFNQKHDRKKCSHDRFMDTIIEQRNSESSISSFQARPTRLDPMLDDVSECEILWEDLVIGERIGLGSYGEVYRADWNGTEVAVKKFLDQDFYGDALDEFRSEVRIMRRLRHPNVVLFMGAVTRPPNLSIVSEFLPRGSLYRILHRPYCQIDEKRRIKMALDVAKGMNCLHTSVPTIVHRDLKSPNLLVDKNWTVKVCDFGLSRLKHNTFLSSKSTAGTPEWMAPEVLRNEPSNEKCDVYSFGVILWELATLRMPWSGMNPMQVVGAVGFQDRRLDIPKEVDPLVGRIIWECWQTDPSLRPSFEQLTTALKSLQRLVIPSHQETQSPPVPQEISVNSTP